MPRQSRPACSIGILVVCLAAASAVRAGVTQRVSVRSGGAEATGDSRFPAISADGDVIAFVSRAADLVDGDNNGFQDVFVHHRRTRTTIRVSVSNLGAEALGFSGEAAISADGKHVAFSSDAANLVDGDVGGFFDVFVRDLETQETHRVSVGPGGMEAGAHSGRPSLSADGMVVAFESTAANLVDADTNNVKDIFVHDRVAGVTTRVSVRSGGAQAGGVSDSPVISADGRYVAFRSDAPDLVEGDTNGQSDIFVHDRLTGATVRVSVGASGQAGGDSRYPAISADGRHVAFTSSAPDHVADDFNGVTDVFVRDLEALVTVRVSVGAGGLEANGYSFRSSISADGSRVAFESEATNLVAGDTNTRADIFVRDRAAGTTVRVSRTAAGAQSAGISGYPAISAGGHAVAFDSFADDLVAGDENKRVDIFVRDARPVCDFDDDGDVDADDVAYLRACRSGPAVPQPDPACAAARLDADDDVDQDDFGIFQRCLTRAGVPADPDCVVP